MSEMKNTYSEWLKCIPAHWNLSKISALYTLRNQKVSDKDYLPLSVTMKGILPQLETAAKTNAHDDRKLVKKGDFAINSRSDRRGSCGISDYDGSVSLINTVMKPTGEMNPGYYNWLFHTTEFADEFYKWGHGIVDDLWTTNWQDMKHIDVPVPPLSEQYRIADFLDSKCSQIDEISKKIQEEIDTLEEYKKSVITETVTKGLDPNVGMIPLKYVVTYNDETLPDNTPSENEFDYIDIGSVFYGKGIVHKERMAFKNAPSRARRIVKNKDTIVSTVRTYLKAVALIENLSFPTVASTGFIVLRPREEMIDSYYLSYVVQSSIFVDEVEARSTGVSYPAISSTEIVDIKIPVPAIEEQINISNYLSRKCGCIDKSIEAKQQQLTTLEEYKKSLIYEYVTGKKEVTNAS